MFGKGNARYIFNGIRCNGTENSLFECAHNTTTECDSVNDAGVRCLRGKNAATVSILILSKVRLELMLYSLSTQRKIVLIKWCVWWMAHLTWAEWRSV